LPTFDVRNFDFPSTRYFKLKKKKWEEKETFQHKTAEHSEQAYSNLLLEIIFDNLLLG